MASGSPNSCNEKAEAGGGGASQQNSPCRLEAHGEWRDVSADRGANAGNVGVGSHGEHDRMLPQKCSLHRRTQVVL